MPSIRSVFVVAAAACAFGCADPKPPAAQAIAEIQSTVDAAGPDVERYAPDALRAIEDEVAELTARFDRKDYKGVIAAAPTTLAHARALTAAAEEGKRKAVQAALQAEWARLGTETPASLEALARRIEVLHGQPHRPRRITAAALEGAQSSLDSARTLWKQAESAHAGGQLEQAVAAARQAGERASTAAAALDPASR